MSGYKFVTREEVSEASRDGWFTLGGLELCERLLSERDAYREVAMKYLQWRFEHDVQMMDEWEGKTTTEDEVDAEATRILEKRT